MIGDLKVFNKIFLAPMAGIADHPFRLICKQHGCGLVYSEMVNARGILSEVSTYFKTYLHFTPEERPIAVQLFGREPETMASAGCLVANDSGADLIDINMGCSVPKILKNREGAWLMKEPDQALRIIERMVEKVNKPVTIKLRKGWQGGSYNAIEMAKAAENLGVKAVAIHGRTVEQRFTGKADWDIIKEVKSQVSIPVIGNGDVTTPHEADRLLNYSGCDAIMIGRAAKGNPWIFSRIRAWLDSKIDLPGPTIEQIKDIMLYHLELLTAFKGEKAGVRELRKHVGWYIKGTKGAAVTRNAINQTITKEGVKKLIQEWYYNN